MPRETRSSKRIDRRQFVGASLLSATAPFTLMGLGGECLAADPDPAPPEIIDTNVHLFRWPFRKLKFARTAALVTKLRKHRVTKAWAGSFEAVLEKQLDAVNRRLAEECRTHGDGMLVPIGSVNPAWADWEEDLKRCHEQYHMPGVRLYPAYHGYSLDQPEFARLIAEATRRMLLVQIVLRLEDERVHHPAVLIPAVDVSPLVDVLKKTPDAKVQLINSAGPLLGKSLAALIKETKVIFDTAAIESNGGIGKVIGGKLYNYQGAIPEERLLFGSHAPFFPCESALMKLFESPLSRGPMALIMNGNARRLIDRPRGDVSFEDWGPPSVREFAWSPAAYGLPTRDDLVKLRIWDMHYHGFAKDGVRSHEENMFYVERMGIERMISLDIVGTPEDPLGTKIPDDKKRELREYLEKHSDRVLGLVPIDPSQPIESCRKIEEWVAKGPCIGIKYFGGNPGGVVCSHKDNDVIIRLAAELKCVIYIHTWLQVGGKPRRPGGNNQPGESTPMDVALLAERFPNVNLVCGHSGGDWEIGVRAVRRHENVCIEFSGSDPHSGQVDYTVSQVGTSRLIWGGHGPSRSYSTELSKVLDADLTQEQRLQIVGGNFRRLAAPILREKGYKL